MLDVHFTSAQPIARPTYAWLAAALQVFTALGAIPVGLSLVSDPTGSGMGMPREWIADTMFGSYFVPGLYLLVFNGLGMLVAAALTIRRHWSAPWLTAILGVGLIVWIGVQLAIIPETSWLQWMFLATGFALGFVALFWLRATRQLRLW